MKEHIIEGLKEGLRVFIVTALPILIVQVENQNVDFRVLFFAGVAGVLKAIDKFYHEYKKEEGTEGAWKGILGF